MTIEKFIWDSENQTVSWSYNGKDIKENFKNAHFATINLQKNLVYVEAGKNYSQDQIYYLSFDGRVIFSYDKVSNKIRWRQKDQLVEVNCKNIVDAQFYIEFDLIIAIVLVNEVDKKMLGYALDGRLLFEKEPPQGYIFINLSTFNSQPSVVCDGGKDNADKYGRSSWHFVINTTNGDMLKRNLAY